MEENSELRLELTTSIVAAFVKKNALPASELPSLIEATFSSLGSLGSPIQPIVEKKAPAVPVKKSVTDDFIICLEDGKKFKSLKRHLMTHFDMTPDEYRAKWDLPPDYPMVAPAYAAQRSRLAKQLGLGRKPAPEPEPEPAPAKRGRKAKAEASG